MKDGDWPLALTDGRSVRLHDIAVCPHTFVVTCEKKSCIPLPGQACCASGFIENNQFVRGPTI